MKKIANVKIGVIGPLLGITIMALALFCFLLVTGKN